MVFLVSYYVLCIFLMYMYNIYFSAFYAMIDIGKWEYKPKRLLNIRCKNPAGSDALLKTYAVTHEIADAQLLTDYIVMAEKRKSRGRSKKYQLCRYKPI